MVRNSAPSPRRSRTAFVGLLLVGALVLSGALAWQVVDAGRSHEEVARKAVGEQALFAVWEFTNLTRRLVAEKLMKPGLEVVAANGGKTAGVRLHHPTEGEGGTGWGSWTYGPDAAGAFFRVELPEGTVAVSGPADASLRRWLEAELGAHLALELGEWWDPVLADPGDGQGMIVYRTYPEGEADPELVFGFRLHPASLSIPLAYAFDDSALLPEALTRGRANGELFSVRVTRSGGGELWRTDADYSSTFTAADTLGGRLGGIRAALTVNPDRVESLTIGGFPSSRLPTALALLLVTGGLVAAAFFQLRREAELSRLRADFVSGVSHELRTPLAQIRMFAETLLLGRVRSDEERIRSLRIIVNESQRLTHQVGNVLLYSRAERERLKVTPQRVDVGVLVGEVAEAFEPLAEKARAELRVETTPGLEARVDGELVRQALLNLLDNATKYGPPGQTIEIGAGRAPGGRILLWVEDEGPGVSAEDRERIWEPYYRLERHRESAVAGSGIGLAVVRQVLEALGGSARVEEGEGGGARFILEIPVGGQEPREPEASGAERRALAEAGD